VADINSPLRCDASGLAFLRKDGVTLLIICELGEIRV